MSRHNSIQSRDAVHRGNWSWAAIIVAVLVGVGFSLLACGFVLDFQIALDASPLTFRLTTAALLAFTALGPRLPRWIARHALHIFRRWWSHSAQIEMGLLSQRGDRDVWWTIASVVGLVASVFAMLLPVALGAAQSFYGWLLRQFLWTGPSLVMCEVLVIALAATPFIVFGLFAQCAHRRGATTSHWDPTMLAWMCGGAGLGLMAAMPLGFADARASVLLRGGAAALMVAAIIVVARSGDGDRKSKEQLRESELSEPDTGPQWPIILRLCIAVAVVAAMSSGLIWVYVADALDMSSDGNGPLIGGVLLVFTSAGLWRAVHAHEKTVYGVGSFGIRCALSGVLLAAGVAVFNLVARASYAAFIGGPGIWLLWGLCAGVPMFAVGWTIGFGVRELLARCGPDADTGSGILQMIFGSTAVALLCVALVLLEYLGSYAAMVALALALLATGGTLVIHQPCSRQRVQQFRLAAVFGGVVGLTFLMPSAGRHWLGHRQRVRGELLESWWVTHDLHRTSTATRDGFVSAPGERLDRFIDWYRTPVGCRVGVISMFGNEPMEMPGANAPRLEQWALIAGEHGLSVDSKIDESDESIVEFDALRALRASSVRFDVLMVSLGDASVEFASFILRESFLRRAWTRLSPDGLQVFLLPDDDALIAELRQALIDTAPRNASKPIAEAYRLSDSHSQVVVYATHRSDGASEIIALASANRKRTDRHLDLRADGDGGVAEAVATGR